MDSTNPTPGQDPLDTHEEGRLAGLTGLHDRLGEDVPGVPLRAAVAAPPRRPGRLGLQRRDLLVQERDELARVLYHEVGTELERGLGLVSVAPELAAGDDPPAAARARRRAPSTSTTPSITPAVAVESATRSGCSDSTSAAMSSAGAPAPSRITSQPSASRKSETTRVPSACSSSGVPETIASRPSFGGRRQPAAEAVEDRLRDGGGVVLLGDVDRAHCPPVTDLLHGRAEHPEIDVRDRDAVLERLFDRQARAGGIACQQPVQEGRSVLVEAHAPPACHLKTGRTTVAC